MAEIVPLTKDTLPSYIASTDTPLIVDFYAEWCQPCSRLLKILPTLATEMEGKVVFGKINVDENRELSDSLGVRTVPTFYIYRNGTHIKLFEGIKTLLEIKKLIEAQL